MALDDLVIQVEAPGSVPSGLQPIAEAGTRPQPPPVWTSDPERAWARLFPINR